MRGSSSISLDISKDRHEAFIVARVSENCSCDATLVWLGGPRPLPPQPDRLAENPGS
jgi:hypothetical protein